MHVSLVEPRRQLCLEDREAPVRRGRRTEPLAKLSRPAPPQLIEIHEPIGQLAGGHAQDHARVTRPEVTSDDRRILARVEGEGAAMCARHERAREAPAAAGRIGDSTVVLDEADGKLHRASRDDALLCVCRCTLRRPKVLDELRELWRGRSGGVLQHQAIVGPTKAEVDPTEPRPPAPCSATSLLGGIVKRRFAPKACLTRSFMAAKRTQQRGWGRVVTGG
jgi:hypothetical protein